MQATLAKAFSGFVIETGVAALQSVRVWCAVVATLFIWWVGQPIAPGELPELGADIVLEATAASNGNIMCCQIAAYTVIWTTAIVGFIIRPQTLKQRDD